MFELIILYLLFRKPKCEVVRCDCERKHERKRKRKESDLRKVIKSVNRELLPVVVIVIAIIAFFMLAWLSSRSGI